MIPDRNRRLTASLNNVSGGIGVEDIRDDTVFYLANCPLMMAEANCHHTSNTSMREEG